MEVHDIGEPSINGENYKDTYPQDSSQGYQVTPPQGYQATPPQGYNSPPHGYNSPPQVGYPGAYQGGYQSPPQKGFEIHNNTYNGGMYQPPQYDDGEIDPVMFIAGCLLGWCCGIFAIICLLCVERPQQKSYLYGCLTPFVLYVLAVCALIIIVLLSVFGVLAWI